MKLIDKITGKEEEKKMSEQFYGTLLFLLSGRLTFKGKVFEVFELQFNK